MFLEANHLTKKYKKNIKESGLKGSFKNLFKNQWEEIVAIDDISFSMEKGESLACIGENGAGKSTLIKMLVGILNPSEGKVRVEGKDPMDHHREYLRKIGVVFGQKTNLWWDIPVIESYEAVKVFYKLDDKMYKRNLDMVTELLDLKTIFSSPARQLSLGQRMKADIGLVFLHSPEILFLDEPTIGLDINIKFAIRKFIRQMNQETGVSIFLTSHDLDDIEEISDTALVLSKGKVFYRGALDKLKDEYDTIRTIQVIGKKKKDIRDFVKVELEEKAKESIITFDTKEYSSNEMLEYISQAYQVEDIMIEGVGIDQVVSKIFLEGAAGK